MTPLVWSVVIAGTSLLAGWFTSRLRWYGWVLATVTQVCWVVHGLTSGQLGFVVSALAFGVLNVQTARRWYRERPDRPVSAQAHVSTATSVGGPP